MEIWKERIMSILTIRDAVLQDAENYRAGKLCSTGDARAALELKPESENNAAGNRYLAALIIIVRLQDELGKLERGNNDC